jgi:tetratricopeptide (TPR) repeat protein
VRRTSKRDAILKKADTLLEQGKLAGAIEEYVRLVDDQPNDWSSINALGDLYLRAGDVDRAIAQFTLVANHLFDEGFYPKAAALYKKVLKANSDHEHSLARLLDIAERQGLTADARMYRQALWKARGVGEEAPEAPEAPAPAQEETVIDEIRVEPVVFDDSDTLTSPMEIEPVPSYLVEEEDSDDRFVVTPADLAGGEAMLQERGGDETSDGTIVIEQSDADIGAALASLRANALVLPPMPVTGDGGAPSLEAVFGEMRARVAAEHEARATEQYERGMRHLDEGRLIEALDDLQASARTPALRFRAAGTLGRVLASRGDYKDACEWMERAAEAPPPSVDEGRSLLYELADALEHLGEHGRALAILLELQGDAGRYRDVAERIERLRDVLQGSSPA